MTAWNGSTGKTGEKKLNKNLGTGKYENIDTLYINKMIIIIIIMDCSNSNVLLLVRLNSYVN